MVPRRRCRSGEQLLRCLRESDCKKTSRVKDFFQVEGESGWRVAS